MRRLYSSFAHGAPGIGLLILRLAVGVPAIHHGFTSLVGPPPYAPAIAHGLAMLFGMLVLAGLWTPIAGSIVAGLTLWELISQVTPAPQLTWIAVIAASLALLGPGAWSVDAWLYGWKQIRISDHNGSGRRPRR